jgi:hypothetical protein
LLSSLSPQLAARIPETRRRRPVEDVNFMDKPLDGVSPQKPLTQYVSTTFVR